uniref:Candidate secreted effector protein n=1 Tax=Steinernema glaseri TaxID=37863 RepID=A0A1I7YSZ3_9BILA
MKVPLLLFVLLFCVSTEALLYQYFCQNENSNLCQLLKKNEVRNDLRGFKSASGYAHEDYGNTSPASFDYGFGYPGDVLWDQGFKSGQDSEDLQCIWILNIRKCFKRRS